MKTTHNKTNQPGKRTHTLKAILESQETPIDEGNQIKDLPNLFEMGVNKSLASSIAEDAREVNFSEESFRISNKAAAKIAEAIDSYHQLIAQEINSTATLMDIDPIQLKVWIDLQIEVPAKTILHFLRTMQSLHLDPFKEELGFTQHEDGSWQVFITIEGCSKILNQHPQFNGLVFHQADTLIEGIPEWIECSIYRRDRIMPITVREYFIEVRDEKPIWKKMPRRMLRHRALQQCVRLAIAA
jgi:hypothetical protein